MSHAAGVSVRAIAANLARSPSTISRELRRNRELGGGYLASSAHAMAYHRASRPKPARLAVNLALGEKVEQDRQKKYSPEQSATAGRRTRARPGPRWHPRSPDGVPATGRGWCLESDEPHEGYVAMLGPDGRASGTTHAAGILFSRRDRGGLDAAHARGEMPTTDEMYESVPWSEVSGWQAQCECGWRGMTWSRKEASPATPAQEHLHPDAMQLPDGTTLEEAGYQQWRRHDLPRRFRTFTVSGGMPQTPAMLGG